MGVIAPAIWVLMELLAVALDAHGDNKYESPSSFANPPTKGEMAVVIHNERPFGVHTPSPASPPSVSSMREGRPAIVHREIPFGVNAPTPASHPSVLEPLLASPPSKSAQKHQEANGVPSASSAHNLTPLPKTIQGNVPSISPWAPSGTKADSGVPVFMPVAPASYKYPQNPPAAAPITLEFTPPSSHQRNSPLSVPIGSAVPDASPSRRSGGNSPVTQPFLGPPPSNTAVPVVSTIPTRAPQVPVVLWSNKHPSISPTILPIFARVQPPSSKPWNTREKPPPLTPIGFSEPVVPSPRKSVQNPPFFQKANPRKAPSNVNHTNVPVLSSIPPRTSQGNAAELPIFLPVVPEASPSKRYTQNPPPALPIRPGQLAPSPHQRNKQIIKAPVPVPIVTVPVAAPSIVTVAAPPRGSERKPVIIHPVRSIVPVVSPPSKLPEDSSASYPVIPAKPSLHLPGPSESPISVPPASINRERNRISVAAPPSKARNQSLPAHHMIAKAPSWKPARRNSNAASTPLPFSVSPPNKPLHSLSPSSSTSFHRNHSGRIKISSSSPAPSYLGFPPTSNEQGSGQRSHAPNPLLPVSPSTFPFPRSVVHSPAPMPALPPERGQVPVPPPFIPSPVSSQENSKVPLLPPLALPPPPTNEESGESSHAPNPLLPVSPSAFPFPRSVVHHSPAPLPALPPEHSKVPAPPPIIPSPMSSQENSKAPLLPPLALPPPPTNEESRESSHGPNPLLPVSPSTFPFPRSVVHHSPAPLPAPPPEHSEVPVPPPIIPSPVSSQENSKAPLLPPLALPPPPPNEDCAAVICSEPLTNTPPGTRCSCVLPMQIELRLGVELYTFFPLVLELAKEIAAGVFMKQSQIRIMGANADTQQPEKTIVLIDLVPLGGKFDHFTAFLTFQRVWKKQVAINADRFGDYEVLFVRYPGLPPSPPGASSNISIADDGPYAGHDNNGRTIQPLGVDVPRKRHKDGLGGSIIAIIVLSAFVAIVLCSISAWVLLFKNRDPVCQAVPSLEALQPPFTRQGAAGSLVGSMHSSTSLSFGSSIATYAGSAKTFNSTDIERATDNFDPSRILGEGGFGCVYSGVLEDGTKVAVKVLKRDDQQSTREFLAEVEMLSRLHHRNLVKLIGICIEERARCLVYELIPNGSVESHLHGLDKETAPLDWSARIKIALGAARGLAYLHEDSSPRVIHRDFKSSNILLEDDFTPKVSDFGLARTAFDEENKHISTRVMGTFGYVAPEYAMTGHLLVKSDVYSYGVVLLELLSGRKPIDMTQPPGQENLVAWARPLLTSEEGLETIVDSSIGPDYPFDSIVKVAAIASMCVQPEVSHRPFMGEVVQALKLVCNECDETRELGSRRTSREDISIDMDIRDSPGSSHLQDPLQSQHSVPNYHMGVDAELGLSASDLFSASARVGRQTSGSFRRHSSSGPVRTGRGKKLWQTMRRLSKGSISEHGMTFRSWRGSH